MEAPAAADRRELVIRTSQTGVPSVAAAIADTGPGLDDEVSKQLFQPFVTTKAESMGLGLALSRSIIDAHGGRLEAMPNPLGGGVRFALQAAEA